MPAFIRSYLSMRVSIRQPLQPFINAKAKELGVDDAGEVVNYLLLQIMSNNATSEPVQTQTKKA